MDSGRGKSEGYLPKVIDLTIWDNDIIPIEYFNVQGLKDSIAILSFFGDAVSKRSLPYILSSRFAES